MTTVVDPLCAEPPVMLGRPDDAALTEKLWPPARTGRRAYRALLLATGAGTLVLFAALGYTIVAGIGVWGNNIPVAWAFAITNFVWWIGIGHAGTFISAILLLLGQKWRTSINRTAEAMTLFAVVQAAIFPLMHLGRPWFFYWLVPYPSEMQIWPQFRSSLPWDVAAVSTYFTVSLLFFYVGLIPDLAAVRDGATGRFRRQVYGVFALGWRGSARQWSCFRIVYGLLAGLATPLVISVHSVVSMDFAISQLPGWHSLIFPPYFVAGAIYSGFAMVLTLLIPIRRMFRLHDVITKRHLDNMAKMLLLTGWIVTYAYIFESFIAWYSGDRYERYTHLFDRPLGPYAVLFWTLVFCNCVVPQLFWSRTMRQNTVVLFGASLLINTGMWLERFVLIVSSEHRDFLPSSWGAYRPTVVDGTILFGTLCFFGFLYLLFLRFLPFLPVSELRELRHELVREDAEHARKEAPDAVRDPR
jgi:molybdopterin-containing oxidoreductase family membrane subunit